MEPQQRKRFADNANRSNVIINHLEAAVLDVHDELF